MYFGGESPCGCVYPRSTRCEGLVWCWGQLLTPDLIPAHGQQLLFTAGHLKAPGLVELGDGDMVVPWAWDEMAPQRGDLHVEHGQGILCS